MKFTLALMLAGIVILAGAAGSSDADPTQSTGEFLALSLLGLGLFSWGVARSRSDMNHTG